MMMDLSWLARVLSRDTRRSSSGNGDCVERESLSTILRVGGDPAPVRTHGVPSSVQVSLGGSSPCSLPKRHDLASSFHDGEWSA
jgi:hypothetical protein